MNIRKLYFFLMNFFEKKFYKNSMLLSRVKNLFLSFSILFIGGKNWPFNYSIHQCKKTKYREERAQCTMFYI